MGRVGFYAVRLHRRWLLLALAAAIGVAVVAIALTASGGHPAAEDVFPNPAPSLHQSPRPQAQPAAVVALRSPMDPFPPLRFDQ